MFEYAVKIITLYRGLGIVLGGVLVGCAETNAVETSVLAIPNVIVPVNTTVTSPISPSSTSVNAPTRELSLATLPITPLNPNQSWIQIGRYRVISAQPTEAQRHLLHVIVNVTLPEEISSIQAAIHYLMAKSGYQFSTRAASPEVLQLLQKPLPAVHRHLGPMTLEDALQTLAGTPYQLIIDPVHRQVQVLLPAPILTLNRRH